MLTRSFALCLAASLSPAFGQGIGEIVRAELLEGWREADGRHVAAVRLELEPGWKTYWRAPGDAGIPPRFDFSGSENVQSVLPHWPVPEVFHQNGLRSVGYSGEVTVPLVIATRDGGAVVKLDGLMEIGVCEEVCVPVSLRLSGSLGPGAEGRVAEIREALSDRPMTASEAGVGAVTCASEAISDGLRVTLTMDVPEMGAGEAVVVELDDPAVWVSEPQTVREGGRLVAVAEMVPPDAKPFAMARQDVRVTVLGGGRAVEIRGCTGG